MIIIEGILVLAMKNWDLCHMKIFVDTDDDLRLARRLKRDTVDRGRSVDGVITQYTSFVKPMFDTFVSPSKKYADVIIPWAQGENTVAIDLIVQHIRTKLGQNDLRRIYPNLVVLPPNFQIRGMHTIIRSAACNRSDFVFYADRLIRLVVEHALGHLPFKNESVRTRTVTPTTACFSKKICGVSIIPRARRWRTPPRLLQGSKSESCSSSGGTGTASRGLGGTPMGGPAPSHANKLKRGAAGPEAGTRPPRGAGGPGRERPQTPPVPARDVGRRRPGRKRRSPRAIRIEVNKRRSALANSARSRPVRCLASCTRRCPATSPSGTCYFWIPS